MQNDTHITKIHAGLYIMGNQNDTLVKTLALQGNKKVNLAYDSLTKFRSFASCRIVNSPGGTNNCKFLRSMPRNVGFRSGFAGYEAV